MKQGTRKKKTATASSGCGYWLHGRHNETGALESLVVEEVTHLGQTTGLCFHYKKGNRKMRDTAFRKAKTYADVTAAAFSIPRVEIHCLEEA